LENSHISPDYDLSEALPMYAYFPVQSISPEQAKRFTKFRERKGLIEKDVVCRKLAHCF
jgi:hypothetical protein